MKQRHLDGLASSPLRLDVARHMDDTGMLPNENLLFATNRHETHEIWLTTEEVAKKLHLRPQSVRARLSRTGTYFGITPLVLPNRRLLWKKSEIDSFLKQATRYWHDTAEPMS
jgi:hypothetical protein